MAKLYLNFESLEPLPYVPSKWDGRWKESALPEDYAKIEFKMLEFTFGSSSFNIFEDFIKCDVNIDVLDTCCITFSGHVQGPINVKKMYADLYKTKNELTDVGLEIEVYDKEGKFFSRSFQVEHFDKEKFICQVFKTKRELNK
jgi:hypothetical protein